MDIKGVSVTAKIQIAADKGTKRLNKNGKHHSVRFHFNMNASNFNSLSLKTDFRNVSKYFASFSRDTKKRGAETIFYAKKNSLFIYSFPSKRINGALQDL